MRSLIVLAALVAAAPAMPVAAAAARAASPAPAQIVVPLAAEPDSLDPLRADAEALVVVRQLYDGLFEFGQDLTARPVLVESVQVSRDGLAYTLHLKRGVTWHDGTPFTAADVVFTMRRHLRPAAGADRWRRLEALAGAKAIDRYTVRLALRYPYAGFLTALAAPEAAILPRHGGEPPAGPGGGAPVGSGPFRLVEWRPDRLVLEANPTYHRGRPGLDRVVMPIVADPAERIAQLEAGEAHLLVAPPAEAVARLSRHPAITTIGGDDVRFVALVFQTAHPALADRRVRQAIALAVDARALRDAHEPGAATVPNGPIPAHSWAYTTAVRPTPHDAARAGRLLAEAGYAPGPDGVLEHDGSPLALDLVVEARERLVALAEAIAADLRRAGMAVSVEPLAPAAWSERFAAGRYAIALLAAPGAADPDPVLYPLLRSGQPGNTGGYASARVDALLDQARAARTQTERRRLYGEVLAVLEADKPIHVLFHRQSRYLLARRYRGFEHVGIPGGLLQSLRRVRLAN